MSVVEQLIEMGFDPQQAKAAEEAAGTLEGAIEWIMNKDSASASAPPPSDNAVAPTEKEDEQVVEIANSYKCNDCGKLFRNEDEITFHASKTKHENFSESSEKVKNLTPEERLAKVAELREKIKLNQVRKSKLEEEDQREKEKKRREDGKAAISRKEEMRDREIREAAQQRRREKSEDEIAKKKVLEQIRLDREARKAQASGAPPPEQKPAAPQVPVEKAPPRNYDVTTIQIRLMSGQAVKQEFKSREPLAMIRAWIETNHSEGAPFTMMTPFPRKVFTEEHMDMPLSELDLVPSANIVLTRR